jgi:hypothetical protein
VVWGNNAEATSHSVLRAIGENPGGTSLATRGGKPKEGHTSPRGNPFFFLFDCCGLRKLKLEKEDRN